MQMRLDHLYRETTDWEASVAFWNGLGFAFDHRWGEEPHRAGRLVGDDAAIVLAEIEPGSATEGTPFFDVSDIREFGRLADAPVVETHWGTQMVTVTDPDGRTYRFEQEQDG
jgi:catechol 2,3-dioxygenase-like lactoylglutathione lyase family enzyme